MGSPAISVPTNRPIQVIQRLSSGQYVLTNSGTALLYLDDDSTCSAATNDFVLQPGATVSWKAGTDCWVIADPVGFPSLDVAQNVDQFSSGNPGALLSSASPIIYCGPVVGLNSSPGWSKQFDCSQFESLTISFAGNSIGTNAHAGMRISWQQNNLVPFPGNQTWVDDYVFSPNVPIGYGWSAVVTIETKGSLFYVQGYQATSMLTSFAGLGNVVVQITGHQSRVPSLAMEVLEPNPGKQNTYRGIIYTVPVIALNASADIGGMPLWSGKATFSPVFLMAVVNAGPMTLVLTNSDDGSRVGSVSWGANDIAYYGGTYGYGGPKTIALPRYPTRLNLYTPPTATVAGGTLNVTLHGSEDT